MKYRLYTYDVWGNTKDGYEVNDIYATSTIIDIDETTTNLQINRRLKTHGIEWEDLGTDEFYGRSKRNNKPIAELRKINEEN